MKKKIAVPLVLMLGLAVFVLAATIQNSPSACIGGWASCSNAYADGGGYAIALHTGTPVSGTYGNYNISIPANSTVSSVVVRLDLAGRGNAPRTDVLVSDGSSYGAVHTLMPTKNYKTYYVDVTSDHNWTPSNLQNLAVNVSCYGSGTVLCGLDWIPVNVTYT